MDKTKVLLLLGFVLLITLAAGLCRQGTVAHKNKAAEALLDFRSEKIVSVPVKAAALGESVSYMQKSAENEEYEIAGPEQSSNMLNEDTEKLIRLHVIANSNSTADQYLKLEVRDAVMHILQLYINQQTGFAEVQQIIREQLPLLEQVAAEVIRQAGYDYAVEAEYGIFEFPAKSSCGLELEAGYYRAVRVVIGAGSGRNWWCVLFPPASLANLTPETAYLSENEQIKCDDYLKNGKHKKTGENSSNTVIKKDIQTKHTTKIYLSEWLNKLF